MNNVDYLVVIGGYGLCPTSPQPGAQYKNRHAPGNVCTSEHYYYKITVVKRSRYCVNNTLYIKYSVILVYIFRSMDSTRNHWRIPSSL